MPSIGEVYNPICEAVREGRVIDAYRALGVAAVGIREFNPEKELTFTQAVDAAKLNCMYYAGYLGEHLKADIGRFLGRVSALDVSQAMDEPPKAENAIAEVPEPIKRGRLVRIRRTE